MEKVFIYFTLRLVKFSYVYPASNVHLALGENEFDRGLGLGLGSTINRKRNRVMNLARYVTATLPTQPPGGQIILILSLRDFFFYLSPKGILEVQ